MRLSINLHLENDRVCMEMKLDSCLQSVWPLLEDCKVLQLVMQPDGLLSLELVSFVERQDWP